jgi:hypothetical protein
MLSVVMKRGLALERREWAALVLVMCAMVSQSARADGLIIRPDRRWEVEVAAAALREAWDYNLTDEDAGALFATLFYHLTREWAVGVELAGIGVYQERVPSVGAGGFALVARWQRPLGAGSWFADAGGGLSYASGIVPERGTRFNYIAQSSVGISRPLTARTSLTTALAWLHLSNNGLAGRARNPDIQAVGVRVGVSVLLARAVTGRARSDRAQPRPD